MGISNIGNQEIIWKYNTPLRSDVLGTYLEGVLDPGLLKPLETSVAGNRVSFGPMSLLFETIDPESNRRLLGKCSTSESVEVVCEIGTIAIGYSYSYTKDSVWYGDFVPLNVGNVDDFNGVVLCLVEVFLDGEELKAHAFSGKSFGHLSEKYCKDNGIPERPHIDVGLPTWIVDGAPVDVKTALYLRSGNKWVQDHKEVYWNGSSFDLVQVDSTVDMSSREQGVYVFGVKAAFSFTDASSPGSVRVFGPFSSDQEALSKLPFEYLLYGVVHWNGSVLSVDDSGLGDFEVKYYTESKIDILKRLKDRPDLGMDNLGLSISKDEGADLPSIKIPNGGVAESNGVAYVVSEEKSLTVPGEEKNYFIRLVVVDDVFLPEITDDPGVWDPMRNGFYDSGDRRIVGHGLTQVMTGGESVYSCSNKGRYQVFLPSGWYRLKLYSGFGGGGQPGGGANGIYGGLGGVASSYDCGELIFYWDAGYLWVYLGGSGGNGTSGSNGHYASGSTAEYQYGGAGGGAGRGEASVVVGLCKTLEVETGVVGYTIAPHADNGVVGGDGFFSPVGAPGGSCEIWRLWR